MVTNFARIFLAGPVFLRDASFSTKYPLLISVKDEPVKKNAWPTLLIIYVPFHSVGERPFVININCTVYFAPKVPIFQFLPQFNRFPTAVEIAILLFLFAQGIAGRLRF